jgi:hypothetical protein
MDLRQRYPHKDYHLEQELNSYIDVSGTHYTYVVEAVGLLIYFASRQSVVSLMLGQNQSVRHRRGDASALHLLALDLPPGTLAVCGGPL